MPNRNVNALKGEPNVKLHVLGFPFSDTTSEWNHCAFSARTTTFATMMSEHFDTYLYGGPNNEADVAEHVPLYTEAERRDWWPDYDAKRDVFNHFEASLPGWRTFNERAVKQIREHSGPGDVLCLTMGLSHKPVADALPDLFHVESGIGYSGVFAPFRIYESWAWRNYITGKYEPSDTVRFYDTVLPRAYEIDAFPEGDGSGGYYLFLGRLTERKGPHVAAMACERIGAKLVVAGQGDYPLPDHVTHMGTVGVEQRAELIGNAIAVFTPSLYLEPLCGVSIEAQLCGTPLIASNWGAMVENVQEGSGFLCDTLAEFTAAAELALTLDRSHIRKLAIDRWSTHVLGDRYAGYFRRLQTLQGDGWYA